MHLTKFPTSCACGCFDADMYTGACARCGTIRPITPNNTRTCRNGHDNPQYDRFGSCVECRRLGMVRRRGVRPECRARISCRYDDLVTVRRFEAMLPKHADAIKLFLDLLE